MRRGVLAPLALAALGLGCASKPAGPPVGISSHHDGSLAPIDKATVYEFDSLDSRPVSSVAFRGKPSVLVFVTTGDLVGQAQVSYLVHMAANDGARVNYAMVALHPRRESVLVDAYRQTLGVDFPVALAEGAAAGPGGPFGEIPAVPTVVLLDREGRIVWKHTGLAKNEEIRGHMRTM